MDEQFAIAGGQLAHDLRMASVLAEHFARPRSIAPVVPVSAPEPEAPIAAQPTDHTPPHRRTNVIGIIAFVVGLLAFLSPVIAIFVGFAAEKTFGPVVRAVDGARFTCVRAARLI